MLMRGNIPMATELIHDRGRGPELIGTRITVYNLLPYFLDPGSTEAHICELYNLTSQQVAAMRAYALNNSAEILERHRIIEARIAEGNPPEIREAAKRTHELVMRFKDWLAERTQAAEQQEAEMQAAGLKPAADLKLPTFLEWLNEQKQKSA
jgi:uncharacterized protein (DUF433 family)